MKKKDASFWSDIKVLDERLKADPDSFCFARLSEIYLKVGLVADALHVARTGVAKHPGYLAGQRALALACNANGLPDESRVILEQVTAAMPEDVDAQKMLASLYVAADDNDSAIRTFRTVLDFRPDDKDSKVELEALLNGNTTFLSAYSSTGQTDVGSGVSDDDGSEENIIQLTVHDIFDETFEEEMTVVPPHDTGGTASAHHDPLSTYTLAELYEQQGFLVKAREIYQSILVDDPANTQLLAKILQLQASELSSENISNQAVSVDFDEELDSSEPVACEDVVSPLESKAFAPLAHKSADNIVDTLEVWLENIRRIKACR